MCAQSYDGREGVPILLYPTIRRYLTTGRMADNNTNLLGAIPDATQEEGIQCCTILYCIIAGK